MICVFKLVRKKRDLSAFSIGENVLAIGVLKHFISVDNMEVKIIGNTISSH